MKPTCSPSHQPIHPPIQMLTMVNTFFIQKPLSYFAPDYLGPQLKWKFGPVQSPSMFWLYSGHPSTTKFNLLPAHAKLHRPSQLHSAPVHASWSFSNHSHKGKQRLMAAATSCGRVIVGTCPTPSRITNSAPGIPCARCLPTSVGTMTSLLP
jgi:hypothetical protein